MQSRRRSRRKVGASTTPQCCPVGCRQNRGGVVVFAIFAAERRSSRLTPVLYPPKVCAGARCRSSQSFEVTLLFFSLRPLVSVCFCLMQLKPVRVYVCAPVNHFLFRRCFFALCVWENNIRHPLYPDGRKQARWPTNGGNVECKGKARWMCHGCGQ